MKQFTDANIEGENHIYTDYSGGKSEDLVYDPLEWQKQGLQQTASGYGMKLTMPWKIHFNGKLYRLYCTHISNAGSVWFVSKGKKIFVS
ncbi:MAG TPA: hypothetical protein PLP33_24760 [Leptospiraceae bacterium]|nr:hypothetical protein [Leptospiraceae bacterium]